MVILFLGDIFGQPGRKAVTRMLPSLKAQYQPDFVLANVENLAGGRGVSINTFLEMKELGIHGFTSGNHIWDNREVQSLFDKGEPLYRPANFPELPDSPCPGNGCGLLRSGDKSLFVINLMGRVFMDAVDCPFAVVDRILGNNQGRWPVLVDMHAETTSEKVAMGWHLDGRVSLVVGTHTHVQTADERIFPEGTAYISDVGMCGGFDSVIGLQVGPIIEKFRTKRRTTYQVSAENPVVCGIVAKIGSDNKAESIERFTLKAS